MPRLMAEIEAYLAFMDEARRDDSLWREHVAWRSKETLRERIEAYSLRDRK
jgi:hypothetical protein